MKLSEKLSSRHNSVDKIRYSADMREKCSTTGKVIWESKRIAKIAAKSYKSNKGPKMSVYQCSCGGWHIGHQLYHKMAIRSGKRRQPWDNAENE